jgi:hypothetical protein
MAYGGFFSFGTIRFQMLILLVQIALRYGKAATS